MTQQRGHNEILKISRSGVVSSMAGGTRDFADGIGASAGFSSLHGSRMCWGADGFLYVANWLSVRRVARGGTVTTFAGSAQRGYADGVGKAAKFSAAMGLAFDADGNLLVADYGNELIRRITPTGKTTTVAGTRQKGSQDGPAEEATFTRPSGIAVGPSGTIYVLEDNGLCVRRISRDKRVTTVAKVSKSS